MHTHTHTHMYTHSFTVSHATHTHTLTGQHHAHDVKKRHTPLKRTHTVEKDTHKKRLSLIRKLFEEVSLKKGFDGSESQLLSTHSMLKYRLCRLFEGVMAML